MSERQPVPRSIPHSPKAFFRHLNAHFGRNGRREPALFKSVIRGFGQKRLKTAKTFLSFEKGDEQILVCLYVGISSAKNSCTDHTPAYLPLSEREVGTKRRTTHTTHTKTMGDRRDEGDDRSPSHASAGWPSQRSCEQGDGGGAPSDGLCGRWWGEENGVRSG